MYTVDSNSDNFYTATNFNENYGYQKPLPH